MTVRDWIQAARRTLTAAGIDSALLDAEVLLAHALGVERSWLFAHPSEALLDAARADGYLSRRANREPLAYIVGYREFFGRRFVVRPGVLIPRQETELLVEMGLELARVLTAEFHSEPLRVLDLGTGSGAIGITLKLQNPALEVTLSDRSQLALGTASENARSLEADVQVSLSDGYKDVSGPFHLTLCNPPYIGTGETLQPEVQDHEPHEALFAGDDSLAFFRRLAAESGGSILRGGFIALEVGIGQAGAVTRLFETNGWRRTEARLDLAGIPRALAFRLP